MTNTVNFAILEALGTFETTLSRLFLQTFKWDFEFCLLTNSRFNLEEHCRKQSTMKHILGLSFALICVCSAYAQAHKTTQYDPTTLPEGLYLTRWWDIGNSPLGPSHGEDIATFTKTGADTYEVVWNRANISVIGFYSSSIGSFSGGYYTEGEDGREENDFGWGGFLFHWNGVTLSGRWIPFGDSLTGYIIFYPLGSTYTLQTALALISHDNGK